MLRKIELECLEESTYSKIIKGFVSDKIATTLYYAISGSKDTHVIVSEDVNKLYKKCIYDALHVWMPPNTIVSSSSSELAVSGEECHINLYGVVKNPIVKELVQHIRNVVFNTKEVRKNYVLGRREKEPCYYFGDLMDVGCTVKEAIQHPDKVMDSWAYWRISDDFNNSRSILDEDGNDVTEDIIPSSTQRFVEAIANTDSYRSINLSKCDIHFY